jgi:dihydrofolate reductase
MPSIATATLSISLDGYGAAPDQSLENPLGVNGMEVHEWFFPTRTFVAMSGRDAGTTGADDTFAANSMSNVGAYIMGRNMFGPVRGPWPDDSWCGWWGPNPPYHAPVFVLTHHPRASLHMEGGTVFHFVTDGIHKAMDRARAAAGDKNVGIGGGVATIRQYLQAKLIDEMRMTVAPTLLGKGEHLFAGLDLRALGYRVAERVSGEAAMHYVISRA